MHWYMLHRAEIVTDDHDSHQPTSQLVGYQRIDCTASAHGLVLKSCMLSWLISRHLRPDWTPCLCHPLEPYATVGCTFPQQTKPPDASNWSTATLCSCFEGQTHQVCMLGYMQECKCCRFRTRGWLYRCLHEYSALWTYLSFWIEYLVSQLGCPENVKGSHSAIWRIQLNV